MKQALFLLGSIQGAQLQQHRYNSLFEETVIEAPNGYKYTKISDEPKSSGEDSMDKVADQMGEFVKHSAQVQQMKDTQREIASSSLDDAYRLSRVVDNAEKDAAAEAKENKPKNATKSGDQKNDTKGASTGSKNKTDAAKPVTMDPETAKRELEWHRRHKPFQGDYDEFLSGRVRNEYGPERTGEFRHEYDQPDSFRKRVDQADSQDQQESGHHHGRHGRSSSKHGDKAQNYRKFERKHASENYRKTERELSNEINGDSSPAPNGRRDSHKNHQRRQYDHDRYSKEVSSAKNKFGSELDTDQFIKNLDWKLEDIKKSLQYVNAKDPKDQNQSKETSEEDSQKAGVPKKEEKGDNKDEKKEDKKEEKKTSKKSSDVDQSKKEKKEGIPEDVPSTEIPPPNEKRAPVPKKNYQIKAQKKHRHHSHGHTHYRL